MFSFNNPTTAAATTTTPASSFSFGHQRNNTTGGLFSTPPANTATNTVAPIFGGGASINTTTPGFGATSTNTTTPGFGTTSTATPGFGTAASNTTSTPGFGTSALNTTTTPGFGGTSTNTTTGFGGASTSTLPSLNNSTSFSFSNNNNNQTKPLFGSTLNTNNPSSSFSLNTNQQQQQQQQSNSLLDLHSVFPDTNVPYFIIKPDGVDRVSVPPSFFLTSRSTGGGNLDPTTTKNKDISSFLNNNINNNNNNNNASSSSTSSINNTSSYNIGMKRSISFANHSREKRRVLPGFLTSSPGDITSTGQKTTTEDDKEKRVLFKSSSTPSSSYGIFSDDQPDKPKTFGKQQNTGKVTIDDPPVLSMWDVGVNPKPPIFSVIGTDLKQNDKSISVNDKYFGMSSKGLTTVNIFGFASEMSDAIFEHFSKCGEVAERGITGGNWMIIKYTTSEGAQNALKNNGRMLFNNHIIGVTLVLSEGASATNNDTSIKHIKLESSKDSIFKNNTSNPSGTLDYIPNLFYSALSSSGIISSSSSSLSSPPLSNNNNNLSEKRITKINNGGIIDKVKDTLFGW